MSALRDALQQRTAMMLGHHAQREIQSGEWVCIRFNDMVDALDCMRELRKLGCEGLNESMPLPGAKEVQPK